MDKSTCIYSTTDFGFGEIQPLDEQFIHPRFAGLLLTDDDARIDHDWFSYKTLLFWVFVKHDPFGTGKLVLPDGSVADLKYRMEKRVYCSNINLVMDDKLKLFIERAVNRLGFVEDFICDTRTSEKLRQDSSFVSECFKKQLYKCSNMIERPSRKRKQPCGFPRLSEVADCPYCEHSNLVKLIA
ncbi:MAG: hypothetical protein WC120_01170 [Parcubacteria group bacterium]